MGGDDPTPNPTPTPGSGSYLFYSGSISAVDPATPASPITVEAGTDVDFNILEGVNKVFAGTYDAATKNLNNMHDHAIVYAKTNGKLYKVSALKSSGTPTPTQLSSETAADKICGWDGIAYDFANPDSSQIVYQTPGANTTCDDGDDVYKMVRLGMSAADAPVTAKHPIIDLNDWAATGALSGWLVNDAGALKRCDASFANCGASLKSIASSAEWEDTVLGSNRILLNIDGALYVYDGDANTLSTALHTIGGTNPYVSYSVDDAAKFYFSTSNAPNSIYAVPVDGSALATSLVTDVAGINDFDISDNKLLYTSATGIKVVAKTGGAASTLVTGTGTGIFQVSGNHVYYTLFNGAVPTAGMIDDDGSNKSELANADWIGSSVATSWNLGASIVNVIQTITRAEGYETLGVDTGFVGATLRSFTTASKAEVGVLGKVPNDIVSIDCSEFFANGLCFGSDAASQTDVFFVNSETPSSLVRVTNTPTKSEALIP